MEEVAGCPVLILRRYYCGMSLIRSRERGPVDNPLSSGSILSRAVMISRAALYAQLATPLLVISSSQDMPPETSPSLLLLVIVKPRC